MFNSSVNKIIAQLMKFGVVGILAFVIDYGIMNLLLMVHLHNVLAATISFIISLAFNYVISMKYVFVQREDMARWMEMTIFIAAAIVGLFINDVIIWISTYGMAHDAMITDHTAYILRTNIGKIVATVIVAVWNFIIRKWLLDSKDANEMSAVEIEKYHKSFSYIIGKWSLTYNPFSRKNK
ncbi:MAG: GtrA family protein [Bifidobacteriaceae bacterium]|nr:GtrA family protein [Bifidobacteriaceae bacterium]